MAMDYQKFLSFKDEIGQYIDDNLNDFSLNDQLSIVKYRRKIGEVALQMSEYQKKVESNAGYPEEERAADEAKLTEQLQALMKETEAERTAANNLVRVRNVTTISELHSIRAVFTFFDKCATEISSILPAPELAQQPEAQPEAPQLKVTNVNLAGLDELRDSAKSTIASMDNENNRDVWLKMTTFLSKIDTARGLIDAFDQKVMSTDDYPETARKEDERPIREYLRDQAMAAFSELNTAEYEMARYHPTGETANTLRTIHQFYSRYLSAINRILNNPVLAQNPAAAAKAQDEAQPQDQPAPNEVQPQAQPVQNEVQPQAQAQPQELRPWKGSTVSRSTRPAMISEELFNRLLEHAEALKLDVDAEGFFKEYGNRNAAGIMLRSYRDYQVHLTELKEAFHTYDRLKKQDAFENDEERLQAEDYIVSQISAIGTAADLNARYIHATLLELTPDDPDFEDLGSILSYFTTCVQVSHEATALDNMASVSNEVTANLIAEDPVMLEALNGAPDPELPDDLRMVFDDLIAFRDDCGNVPFETTYRSLENREKELSTQMWPDETDKERFEAFFPAVKSAGETASIRDLIELKAAFNSGRLLSEREPVDRVRNQQAEILSNELIGGSTDANYRDFCKLIVADALNDLLGKGVEKETVETRMRMQGIQEVRIPDGKGGYTALSAEGLADYLHRKTEDVRNLEARELQQVRRDRAFVAENIGKLDSYIELKTIASKKAALAKAQPEAYQVYTSDRILELGQNTAKDLRRHLTVLSQQLGDYWKVGANSTEFNRFRTALEAAAKGGSLSALNREARNYVELKTKGDPDAEPSTENGRNRLGIAKLVSSLTQYNQDTLLDPSLEAITGMDELRTQLRDVARSLDSKSKIGFNTTEYNEFRAALTKASGEHSTEKDFVDLFEKASTYRDLKTNYDLKDRHRQRSTEAGQTRLDGAMRVIELTEELAGKRTLMTSVFNDATAKLSEESWKSMSVFAQTRRQEESRVLQQAKAQKREQAPQPDEQEIGDLSHLQPRESVWSFAEPEHKPETEPNQAQKEETVVPDQAAGAEQQKAEAKAEAEKSIGDEGFEEEYEEQPQPEQQPEEQEEYPLDDEPDAEQLANMVTEVVIPKAPDPNTIQEQREDQIAKVDRAAAEAKEALMGGILNTQNKTVTLSEQDRERCIDVLLSSLIQNKINEHENHSFLYNVDAWRYDEKAAAEACGRFRRDLRSTFFPENKEVYATDELKGLVEASPIKTVYLLNITKSQNNSINSFRAGENVEEAITNILAMHTLLGKEPGPKVSTTIDVNRTMDQARYKMGKPECRKIIDSLSSRPELIDRLRQIKNPDKLAKTLVQDFNRVKEETAVNHAENLLHKPGLQTEKNQMRQQKP